MQKRTLLVITTVLLISGALQAQIKKGAVFLGGSIGFSTGKSSYANPVSNVTNNSFSISPVFGRAIKENLVLGFDLSYSHSTGKSSVSVQKNNSYGAGVFVRQYKPLGKGFYLFGQSRLSFGYVSDKQEGNAPVTGEIRKLYGVAINFYPGISYAVTNKLQLEAGLDNLLSVGYNHQELTGDGKSNYFGFNSSLSNPANFTVGVRFLMN